GAGSHASAVTPRHAVAGILARTARLADGRRGVRSVELDVSASACRAGRRNRHLRHRGADWRTVVPAGRVGEHRGCHDRASGYSRLLFGPGTAGHPDLPAGHSLAGGRPGLGGADCAATQVFRDGDAMSVEALNVHARSVEPLVDAAATPAPPL